MTLVIDDSQPAITDTSSCRSPVSMVTLNPETPVVVYSYSHHNAIAVDFAVKYHFYHYAACIFNSDIIEH